MPAAINLPRMPFEQPDLLAPPPVLQALRDRCPVAPRRHRDGLAALPVTW